MSLTQAGRYRHHGQPQAAQESTNPELISRAGAEVLFLPSYSPDLNPIEKMWSKIKAILRGTEARTPEELDNAIAAALEQVTTNDARGWFVSCDYSFI